MIWSLPTQQLRPGGQQWVIYMLIHSGIAIDDGLV